MKITSVNQNEAISKYLNCTPSQTTKTSPKLNVEDSVEMSDGAQKFSNLIKSAKEALKASGSDEELKVSDIIDKINNNSYDIPTDDIVSGILYSSKGE